MHCEKGFQVSEGVIEQLKDVPPFACLKGRLKSRIKI